MSTWATASRTGVRPFSAGLTAAEFALAARLPIFTGLDETRLRMLLDRARVRSFERKVVLFLQDEPATRFYVILDGWVRLYRQTAEGHESTIAVYTRGESFAEAAILQSGAFPVNAVVVDDARLLVIEAEPFLRHLRADPRLCLNHDGLDVDPSASSHAADRATHRALLDRAVGRLPCSDSRRSATGARR